MPRYSLEYVILACGGEVTLDNTDSSITHVIADRDNIKKEKTKEYVQPQWVYDSVNFDKLLNVKEYQIGKVIFMLRRLFLLIFHLLWMKTMLKDIFRIEKGN